MKRWLDDFLGEFHKNHLKVLGFRKVRRTFSRDHGEYRERFNFQGSMSNYSDIEDWHYYINVGVEFKDLEPRKFWSYFPHTHWSERIECVVKSAPKVGKYNAKTNKLELAEKLNKLILEASEIMSGEINGLRTRYLEGETFRTV